MEKSLKPYEVSELHKAIIDEWYVNGFNAVKAVLAVSPDSYTYASAGVVGAAIVKDKRNKPYIDAKRTSTRSAVLVENEQLIGEWVNFAFSDITDYIGLSLSELKELPPPVRRCLTVIDVTTKEYFDKKLGAIVKEEHVKLKLTSKERFHEMLAKHLDLFSANNKGKQPVINLTKIDKVTINDLLQAMEKPNE